MPSLSIDLSRISRLRELRERAYELNRDIDTIATPILTDFALLSEIYQVYCDMFARRGMSELSASVYHRKKFILVAIYLYSPKTLAGGKMRVGLRDAIASLFGLTTGSPISDNTSDVVLYYRQCPDFRRDVDIILDDVSRRLSLVK